MYTRKYVTLVTKLRVFVINLQNKKDCQLTVPVILGR